MRILVVGGSGFVGRHLVARLATANHSVTVPTRRYTRGRNLQTLPGVTIAAADVYDDAALDQLVQGKDAVVNLIGILQGNRGKPYGSDFAHAHVDIPRRIAQSCRRHNVQRLLHVSALGADSNGPSMYLRSKGDGEAEIRKIFSSWGQPGWTFFQPSVIFGADDNFTNMFASLARWFPVIPLAGANALMQPVYVGDVVDAIERSLADPRTHGKSYPLTGPQVYTLGEIARSCAAWSGHPRPVINVPSGLARIQAFFMERLPGPVILSRDNLDSMKVASTSSTAPAPELGLVPTGLETVAPRYLAHKSYE
jgi:uncharacterized protein YbjT (DUF2867 family)